MSPVVFNAENEAATAALGHALADVLPAGTTVAMYGTLGAGKTRLVQAIAEGLGVDRRDVVSPTFVLIQEYRGRRMIYSHRRLSPPRQRRVPATRPGRVLRKRRAGAHRMGRPRRKLVASRPRGRTHRGHRCGFAAIRASGRRPAATKMSCGAWRCDRRHALCTPRPLLPNMPDLPPAAGLLFAWQRSFRKEQGNSSLLPRQGSSSNTNPKR